MTAQYDLAGKTMPLFQLQLMPALIRMRTLLTKYLAVSDDGNYRSLPATNRRVSLQLMHQCCVRCQVLLHCTPLRKQLRPLLVRLPAIPWPPMLWLLKNSVCA